MLNKQHNNKLNRQQGFTIVELLIVIVVIAILAAISIVAYNGIQQRGRDAQRVSDLKTVYKAILNYQTINGSLPICSGYAVCASTATVPANWGRWQELAVVPSVITAIPTDPLNQDNTYGYYYARNHAMNSTGSSVHW